MSVSYLEIHGSLRKRYSKSPPKTTHGSFISFTAGSKPWKWLSQFPFNSHSLWFNWIDLRRERIFAVGRRWNLWAPCSENLPPWAVSLCFSSAIKFLPRHFYHVLLEQIKPDISGGFISIYFQWVDSLFLTEIWLGWFPHGYNAAHFVHVNDKWLIRRLVNKETDINVNHLYVMCQTS